MSSSVDEEPARLGELVELLVSTETIEDFLNGLTVSAAAELATFDGPLSCGITVRLARRGPATVGSSDALALALDETQYAAGSGPCLEALDTGTTVTVTDATSETRWPGYVPAAREQGMAASLSVPIPGPAVSAGALAVAMRLAERADVSEHMQAALGSRSTIDQALGILMAQRKINADDAFVVLRRLSQETNIKLRNVAAFVIEQVTGEPPRPPPEPR